MLLAVDARNRALSLGFREGGRWLAITRLGISPERSSDEYAFFMDAARGKAAREGGEASGAGVAGVAGLSGAGPAVGAVESAWISSVVPSFTTRIVEATRLAFGLEAHVVGPGVRTGIKIRTDLPSEVGSDLVCACIAAREIVGAPCIVINFGTVLSFSAVDASGDFVGASFVPGLVSAAETLKAQAAQIPDVRIARPERAIGRNTIQSVQSGLTIGYGGLVTRMVERMSAELAGKDEGRAVHVVGTGSEEGRAILALEGFGSFIPDLALEGIAIVASRNAS
jgi:type III pantothenate kinase